jgi:DNA repair photolyase
MNIVQSPYTSMAYKGRAAAGNALSFRFQNYSRVPDLAALDEQDELPRLRTEVRIEQPKTILSRNQSPDLPFDVSVNAYRGCEHGCIYCFARPTHAYLDLSPGLDFETRLTAKPDAPKLVEAALMARGYTPTPIAMGTNTDPYQPIESRYRITRGILQVLERLGHPCSITTKSHRVTEDVDVLTKLAARQLVLVNISITTLNPDLARAMEPRAASPAKRLAAIETLSKAGIPVNAFVSPLIPQLNDHELDAILAAAKNAGARGASSIAIRLPFEVAPLFRSWLDTHYPDRAARIMHHISDMRGGRDNDPRFGHRMKGQGAYADMMHMRFAAACRKHGLTRDRFTLSTDHFKGYQPAQGDLFAA